MNIQYFSRVVSLVVVELILNTTNKKEAIEQQVNLAKLLWHGESEGTPQARIMRGWHGIERY